MIENKKLLQIDSRPGLHIKKSNPVDVSAYNIIVHNDKYNKRGIISRDITGVDIMLYTTENILAKLLTREKLPIEDFCVELNLRNQK